MNQFSSEFPLTLSTSDALVSELLRLNRRHETDSELQSQINEIMLALTHQQIGIVEFSPGTKQKQIEEYVGNSSNAPFVGKRLNFFNPETNQPEFCIAIVQNPFFRSNQQTDTNWIQQIYQLHENSPFSIPRETPELPAFLEKRVKKQQENSSLRKTIDDTYSIDQDETITVSPLKPEFTAQSIENFLHPNTNPKNYQPKL